MSDTTTFFSRQAAMDELDLASLRRSSALVVGLGNVGGPAALELARAGFGRIVLIDNGVVEPENLSRGIFRRADLGLPKAVAAANVLAECRPGLDCNAMVADVRVDVAEDLFGSCDAVLIATDSWSSRMYINRWAHALPGNAKIVISGGIRGLSWDMVSSVPGSSTGCAQCPHAEDIVRADEAGGCGIIGTAVEPRVDPSVSFTGAVLAGYMVMEACASVGGRGPLFAGRMLSFDYDRAEHDVFTITPDPLCSGHRPLAQYQESVAFTRRDVTANEIAEFVALSVGSHASDVIITSEREVIRERTCLSCGDTVRVGVPVVKKPDLLGIRCPSCGASSFEFDIGTEIHDRDAMLACQGVPPGKAVIAYVGGRRIYVLRQE